MVPKRGLEPPHPCEYMDLNHARLPIPPLRHEVKTGREYLPIFTKAESGVKLQFAVTATVALAVPPLASTDCTMMVCAPAVTEMAPLIELPVTAYRCTPST